MTLPSSGSISMRQINLELGKAAGAGISLNGNLVRGLAGISSGKISMSDLRGKSSYVREPASGEYFTSDVYGWINSIMNNPYTAITWNGANVYTGEYTDATTIVVDGWTYHRGSLFTQQQVSQNPPIYLIYYYVWRDK